MKGAEVLHRSSEMSSLKVIQTLTAGVENFLPYVPDGVQLCNAAGVHDASTAELAVGLIIASGRAAGRVRPATSPRVAGHRSSAAHSPTGRC